MKKIFTLILAGVIACSISACGGTSQTNSTETQPAPKTSTQSIDEKNDVNDKETSSEKEVEEKEIKEE